jgi:hypothetical protein
MKSLPEIKKQNRRTRKRPPKRWVIKTAYVEEASYGEAPDVLTQAVLILGSEAELRNRFVNPRKTKSRVATAYITHHEETYVLTLEKREAKSQTEKDLLKTQLEKDLNADI